MLTISQISRKVQPILKQYGIDRVYLFGSYARGEADQTSDIDLAFESSEDFSYFDIFRIENELEVALGKRVDLVPVSQLAGAETPIGRYLYENGYLKEKVTLA